MKCSKCNFINEEYKEKCFNCGSDLIEDSTHEAHIVPENYVNIPKANTNEEEEVSSKAWGPVLILCLLLGLIGFHRFYVGKAGTAIFMLLTLGGFGIWTLVDLVIIIIGEFTDENGRKVVRVKHS